MQLLLIRPIYFVGVVGLLAACVFEFPTAPPRAERLKLFVVAWPDSVVVGDSALLEVAIHDEKDRPFSSSILKFRWQSSRVESAGLHPAGSKTRKWILAFAPGTSRIKIKAEQPAEGGEGGQSAISVELERDVRVVVAR